MQDQAKISTYNSMEQIIFRINDLWAKFNYHVLQGNLIKSNWVLDRLWGEFVTDATTPETKKTKAGEEKKDDTTIFGKLQTEYGKINKIKDRDKLYLFLMKKEKFLRLLQDHQGKGVKHQESALDYMDG